MWLISTKRLAWLLLVAVASVSAQSHAQDVDAAARARFERGVALAEAKPAQAIEVFEGLTRDYPDWPEPYNNLAVLYARQGEEKKAEQALLAAMATHPSYALVHKNLEALYAGMARRAYRKALQEPSGSVPPPKLALAERLATPTPTARSGAVTVASRAAPTRAEPQPETKIAKAPTPPPAPPASVAKAAATAPAKAAPPPPSAEAARREVLATVAAWLEAWSSQDVERYLSFYGHHFDPGKGVTRERWEALRRKRVSAPEFIEISIDNPSVSLLADGRAVVRFLQTYRSNTFDGQTHKTLRLSRGDEGWKILREETGG